MNAQGLSSTDIEIVDISVIIATGMLGIAAVSGVTLMGPVNTPELDECLIGSWQEFVAVFGGQVSYSLFPLICRRALEGGCTLRVNRIAHYTNVDDDTTCTGVAALVEGTSGLVDAVAAIGTIPITTIDAAGGDTLIATVTISGNTYEIGTRVTAAASNVDAEATAWAAAITAAEGTNGGYTATAAPAGTVTILAPIGLGAVANSYTVGRIVVLGSGTTTVVAAATGFAGGVTGVPANSATFTAVNIGEWGNGVSVLVAPAANGNASEVDITVSIAGYPQLQQLVSGVTQAITAPALALLNNQLTYIQISGVTNGIPTGTFNLATGSYDNGSIVETDYTGSQEAGIGYWAFDECHDFVKIAIPEMAINVIDLALSNYAVMRGDCISLHRTPTGISGNTAVAYRQCTTPYSGTPLNTWQSFMFFDGLNAIDEDTLLPVQVTGLGDILGLMGSRDSNTAGPWFSFSGPKRGLITNSLNGVIYNLGTPARKTEADNVVNNGICPIIDHPTYGTASWGNVTLQKAATMLSKTEVAELCIFIKRAILPLVQADAFDPNDVDTWKTIYKNIKPLMDTIQTNRGIWRWLWQGDQDIMDISQAVINSPSANPSLDGGMYLANLWIAPKVGMIYMGIQIGVTNSDVTFTQLTGQPQ